jgi:hypothetical protein
MRNVDLCVIALPYNVEIKLQIVDWSCSFSHTDTCSDAILVGLAIRTYCGGYSATSTYMMLLFEGRRTGACRLRARGGRAGEHQSRGAIWQGARIPGRRFLDSCSR